MSERVVTEQQWLADCEVLLLAAMYGSPPGGWSDPDRISRFKASMSDIERRMREASDRLRFETVA